MSNAERLQILREQAKALGASYTAAGKLVTDRRAIHDAAVKTLEGEEQSRLAAKKALTVAHNEYQAASDAHAEIHGKLNKIRGEMQSLLPAGKAA